LAAILQPATGDLPRPRWDAQARELWFAGQLVKRFQVPAENQTLILRVFEEEGWPRRIDDPLPGAAPTIAKRRLHGAIQALNASHIACGLLRFHGDGTGQGVLWRNLIS
jgi:hypothetical protein